MATRLSIAAQNAAANAIAVLPDADVPAGTIQIRTGAQPATANDPATGTLLATFTLNDPAFGSAVAGVATLDVTPGFDHYRCGGGNGGVVSDAGWFR